jgi:hypothetical protein
LGRATDFSTRSDQADLPARLVVGPVVQPGRLTDLLNAEAEADAWRIVEVFSRSSLPFDLDLSWSSGSGSGASARLTVAVAARVCVHARSLKIAATNLTTAPNRVGVTVADGFAVTRNTLELLVDLPFGAPVPVSIPSFAEVARVELGTLAAWATTEIAVRDALGDIRALYLANQQPPNGVPVGGASQLQLTTSALAAPARVVFTLSL